jgi:hypothetical protein
MKTRRTEGLGLMIRDIMHPDGKIFLRPEFGRIGKAWPCIAFRLMSELEKLAGEYDEERDIVLGTGTLNADNTRDPAYRGKILTVTIIETRYAPTQEIVPPASWAHHCREHGGEAQWPHCLPALRIFSVGQATSPYPKAGSFIPNTYRALSYQFGRGRAAGGAIQVWPGEQRNLMTLPLTEVTL